MVRATGETKKPVRLKWKLFAYFVAFIAVSLIVIWILQILLLNGFYQRTRLKQMESVANNIESAIGIDDFRGVAISNATDHSMCIRVFAIDDDKGTEVLSVEGSGACFIHFMDYNEISLLYDQAINNGGCYLQTFTFDPHLKSTAESDPEQEILAFEGTGVTSDVSYSNAAGSVLRGDSDIIYAEDQFSSAVYIRIINADDGRIYAILINADLLPIASTVQTLKTQFVWITVIMCSVALLFSVLSASKIACPVARMNESAKLLAKGQYNVVFDGKGCAELAELAGTLTYAAKELSQTDRLQKELIANISHDLRTPLTMICGYGEVMRDIPGENNAENIQVIIDEATRMSALVTDLLDISKIQSGALKPVCAEFDITETVQEVMQRYSKLIDHDSYEITFDYTETVCVFADKTMILQVIYNLINNAINYCGADKTVKVTQELKVNKVRITVADNGDGIAPENIPHIWDRYYKTDSVHKRSLVGTGLGLSIVKQILEQHNASYGVYSTPGVGTAFWIELDTIN